MSDTMILPDTITTPGRGDEGDHDRMAHYVNKDQLMEAILNGTALRALCGKMWVPTRDGLKFPVCPECKEKWEELPE